MLRRLIAWSSLAVVAACARPTPDSVVPTVAESSADQSTPGPHPAPAEAVASPPGVELAVATWNVRRCGQADTDLDRVAEVLGEFDVVAMQEVMTRDVVEALRARLPGHAVLLTDTPRPQKGSYREYYAFVYRTETLDPVLNTFVADPEDRFARDPYLACFEVSGIDEHLCLMTVHITWGDRVAERKAEILSLDDALRWAEEADPTAAWVVLGDFNRPVDDGDRDTEPEEEWRELLDRRGLRVPVVLAGTETPSTLGREGYANAYDHIFVSDELAGEIEEAGRLDVVARMCGGSFEECRARVSDHAPVFVRLELGGRPRGRRP